jgi:DNA-directed RNA polymerase subunit RPC12/RpoP
MNPLHLRIRRWASYLPDGMVAISILLLVLSFVCLLMAAVTVFLAQFLRLAGGNENWILFIEGMIFVLGLVLVFPMFVAFAYLVDVLIGLVGTQCPSCGKRELEWQSGIWKYGEAPAYKYYACLNCSARFRQLCGGQGVLSELERAET